MAKQPQSNRPSKKPYTSPQLQEYGNVAKLTGKSGPYKDGKSGMIMEQQCL